MRTETQVSSDLSLGDWDNKYILNAKFEMFVFSLQLCKQSSKAKAIIPQQGQLGAAQIKAYQANSKHG